MSPLVNRHTGPATKGKSQTSSTLTLRKEYPHTVNFATSKNMVVKSTMFPHRNIHKYTWTSPDGKTHNQIDHVLIDRRWHSSMLDVRSFRGADCDTDQYLVIAKG